MPIKFKIQYCQLNFKYCNLNLTDINNYIYEPQHRVI